jgi:hypothetical protein
MTFRTKLCICRTVQCADRVRESDLLQRRPKQCWPPKIFQSSTRRMEFFRTPICSQQRAPRRWLIGPLESRAHCRIAINFGSSSTRPVPAKAWATAPQFCGLKKSYETGSTPAPISAWSRIRRTRRRCPRYVRPPVIDDAAGTSSSTNAGVTRQKS